MNPIMLTILTAATITAGTIFPDGTSATQIATGFQFTESPTLFDGSILFSDVRGETIYRITATGTEPFLTGSFQTNGTAVDSENRLIMARHKGRDIAMRNSDGSVVSLVSSYEGKKLNSPNDLVIHSDGSIWFTDPPYGIKPDQSELQFNGIFRFDPKSSSITLIDSVTKPNGILFSPDESKLYVADTDTKKIWQYDIDLNGSVSNRSELITFAACTPDGITNDSTGTIFVAGSTGMIYAVSPEGLLLDSLAVPEKTTNLLRTGNSLWITSGTSIYRYDFPEQTDIQSASHKISHTPIVTVQSEAITISGIGRSPGVISTLSGKIVRSFSMEDSATISTINLASGVYLIRVGSFSTTVNITH